MRPLTPEERKIVQEDQIFWDRLFKYSVAFIVFIMLVGATWIVYLAFKSNGETDYCYIEWYSPREAVPMARLSAHVPWRQDRRISYFKTMEEAVRAAQDMKCPLEHK